MSGSVLRKLSLAALVAAGCLAAPRASEAHFLWVGVEPTAAGQATACVWFGELAEPGEAKLLDRVANVQVWSGGRAEQGPALELSQHVEGEVGGWCAPVEAGTHELAAAIDYGIVSRGDETFMLHYYARYTNASTGEAIASQPPLPLDVQARVAGDKIVLTVLAQGAPLADAEVVVSTPSYNQIDATTDAQGQVQIDYTEGGRYSIRARQITSEAGALDGEQYDSTRSYATLTLDVSAPTQAAGSDILSGARQARAVWYDFPGFTAQVFMQTEAGNQLGTLTVAANGDVSLEGIDDSRVMTALRSLVQHRMPGETDAPDVSLVEEATEHPLGQLVNLDYDVAMGSSYRVRDSVVRQVNREVGPSRFSISVLDYERNAEGAYLPTVFNVSTWAEDGSLASSTTVQERWQRIEGFDLPTEHFMVIAGDNQLEYVDLVFSEHELLPADQ